MKPINIAFVGCGFVSQQCHLPAFSSTDKFRIVHLADPCSDLRERISKKYEIANQFSSHKQILGRDDFEAAIVVLPRKLTFNVVRDLALDGKYVLTEKPISINSKDGYKLIDDLKFFSNSIKTGYMKQHDLGTKKFIELLHKFHKDSDLISIHAGVIWATHMLHHLVTSKEIISMISIMLNRIFRSG